MDLSEQKESDNNTLICGICDDMYMFDELDELRQQRLNKAHQRNNDFGMEGPWHCPKCAASPIGVYTTWICLSELEAPNDSILAVAPKTHLLTEWDLPLNNKQLPGDFNWKLKWEIPKSIGYGDIIIFNIKTIHASSANASSPRAFRCSFDTRVVVIVKEFFLAPLQSHDSQKFKKYFMSE